MEALIGDVNAAHGFMKKTISELRDSESAKLTDIAREIWAALKQESNVNLGKIQFVGAANRRHVKLYADVDDREADGGALGVMSQGELHALGLAIPAPGRRRPAAPSGSSCWTTQFRPWIPPRSTASSRSSSSSPKTDRSLCSPTTIGCRR